MSFRLSFEQLLSAITEQSIPNEKIPDELLKLYGQYMLGLSTGSIIEVDLPETSFELQQFTQEYQGYDHEIRELAHSLLLTTNQKLVLRLLYSKYIEQLYEPTNDVIRFPVCTFTEIAALLWNEEFPDQSEDYELHTKLKLRMQKLIDRTRAALEEIGAPFVIQNQRNIGFYLTRIE